MKMKHNVSPLKRKRIRGNKKGREGKEKENENENEKEREKVIQKRAFLKLHSVTIVSWTCIGPPNGISSLKRPVEHTPNGNSPSVRTKQTKLLF